MWWVKLLFWTVDPRVESDRDQACWDQYQSQTDHPTIIMYGTKSGQDNHDICIISSVHSKNIFWQNFM